MPKKIFASFCLLLILNTFFKFFVDVCLPDHGSQIFGSELRPAGAICEFLADVDESKRREIAIFRSAKGWYSVDDAESAVPLANAFARYFAMPTVFFGEVPVNGTCLATILIFCAVLGMLIGAGWQLLSEILSPENADLSLVPPQRYRASTSAIYRIKRSFRRAPGDGDET